MTERGTFASYLSGFILSLVFTLAAYFSAVHHIFSSLGLTVLLLALAIVQFVIQLFFFLHVGRETKPRWKLLTLFFMIVVALIVVIGSIWIMYNLNYRMSPQQINQYMQNQSADGL